MIKAETGPARQWHDALAQGHFMIQRSKTDGAHIFPPRVSNPDGHPDDLDWVEASGLGTVYAVTIIRPKPPTEPYNVVLVDLDEGPRMMSRVEGLSAEQVSIGQRVKARIDQSGDQPILLFDLVQQS